jgi:Glycosyltransferases, probably involved in cell wall biogenesis
VSFTAPVRVKAKFFREGDRKFFVKGTTYGPFAPDAAGEHFGAPEKAKADLAMMHEAGLNLVRVYYLPPRWFLDACAEYEIRCLVSIPWAEHIEFLNQRKTRREIEKAVVDAVTTNRGHPAVFGYLVGNEIPSHMVRWLGPGRVTEFVEHLIFLAKRVDPEVLYSYASFPPTEYLLPQNADFLTFNVYLHRQEDFDRYLARLQNLAEDRPLMLGEFGMDTIRHSEDEQAEMISWHIESVVRGGLAGTIIYAWTDEWFRGGQEITDWAFGLVTRGRKPKKAYARVKALFAGDKPLAERVPLEKYPRVSVVVCSYNGGKTLGGCLAALDQIDYPDYEIVLVDDGSADDTPEVVAAWEKRREARRIAGAKLPGFLNIRQKNMGLSYARNAGACASTGEVIAYTDSDCMADPDWLYYLMGTLISGHYAGVGGPNISPPAQDWIQACVAAAPGGPSHVLLTDVVAEHIPGCNMAFHRWAFDAVGGFDPDYRKAGDDVDFCWRLQQSGQVIAFSPAAIVWHYRRFTLGAFRKQQEGYGEAESMLRFKHLIFFRPDRDGEVERSDLRGPALYLADQPSPHLPRRFWRRPLPKHLSHPALRGGELPGQPRVGFAHRHGLHSFHRVSRPAHRALPHVRRNFFGRSFLHAAGPPRAAIRLGAGAPACRLPRLQPTAGPRLEPLLHLAEIQTHTGTRHPHTRAGDRLAPR